MGTKMEETKSEGRVEMLGKVPNPARKLEAELREVVNEVVDQRLTKPKPTETLDEATAISGELRRLADEVRTNSAKSRTVMLASIEILLAGADILSWDCIQALRDERGTLQGGMQSHQLEEQDAEEAAVEGADEAAAEAAEEDVAAAAEEFKVSDSDVEDIEKRVSMWVPKKQAAILRKVASRIPEKQREYEIETRRDEARDNLINYLMHNRSYEEETAICQRLLALVKSGESVVELKGTTSRA